MPIYLELNADLQMKAHALGADHVPQRRRGAGDSEHARLVHLRARVGTLVPPRRPSLRRPSDGRPAGERVNGVGGHFSRTLEVVNKKPEPVSSKNDLRPHLPHTLEDHLLGMDPMHSHEDGEADHDHDHDDVGGEYDPTTTSLWLQDNITLLSVGIDIGSAGTQVIFSRVQLRRLSEDLTSRYFVVGRETRVPVAGRADALSERRAHRRPGDRRASSTRRTRPRACIPTTSTPAR